MHFKSLFPVIITAVVLLLQPLFGSGQSIATEKVTLSLKDENLAAAIKKIEQQSVFRFFYRDADIAPVNHLNLDNGTRTIEQTLSTVLQNTELSFRQMEHHILLERKNSDSRYEIKGKIVNSADKQAVANASVFLSKTFTGTKTGNDGFFTLYNVKPGKYQLTISIVGFETYMQAITVENNDIILPDIVISPQIIALKEVTVKSATSAEKEKYFGWFTDEFIGTSELAQGCKILNPEILELDYDEATDMLTASAPDFLEIENNALGYKIKYKLTDFRVENQDKFSQKVHYDGYSLFEEMKGSPSQQKRWQKRRQKVYEGSPMHFLRSALAGRMDQEGFWVLPYLTFSNPARPGDSLIEAKINFYTKLKTKGSEVRDSLLWWSKRKDLPKTRDTLLSDLLRKKDVIRPTDRPGLFALGLTNHAYSLYVNYNKHHSMNITYDKNGIEHHDLNIHSFDDLSSPQNTQNTLVRFNAPYAFFDQNGIVVNSNDLTYSGVWGRERVAELLPIDYDPLQNEAVAAKKRAINDLSPAGPVSSSEALLKIKAISDSVSEIDASEKPYLQLDKDYYAMRDTIWYKAYLLKATSLAPSEKSGIMYIDLVNDSSKIVKRFSITVQNGFGWGNISLSEKEFGPGTYTLRAYTNWMRNFNNDYFFYKTFYLAGAGENNWLINKQLVNADDSREAHIKLLFSDMDRKPDTGRKMLLNVFAGDKHLYKQTLQLDKNGLMDFNMKFPEGRSKLIIIAENAAEKKKAVIPVALNQRGDVDVQFLAEGGNLVAGLPSFVGFKAIGEDGRGVDISGVVLNNDKQQVAEFKSLHNGMGSFELTPNEGEKYIARVNLIGGLVKEYPLPEVKSSGIVLHVQNQIGSDSLKVSLTASNDFALLRNNYFLIARARGIVCYAAVVNFKEGNFIKRKIAKSLFPAGIVHFTLMNLNRQPLCERLAYIDRGDLHIQVLNAGQSFKLKDSVVLKIKVTDADGDPVAGNFSLAVTDDAKVKTDSLNHFNINDYLLLTSDLKGYVEKPGYYLSTKTPETWQALDNLLLTQGWVGYDWKNVFSPPANTYQPERDFKIQGNVVNVFNKPVKGTNVFLFSVKPAMLIDTLTNDKGKFVFDRLPRVDTAIFVLKAVNKNDKSFNVVIRMDEIQPPAFALAQPDMAPWYVNSDSTLINYARSNALQQELAYYKATGHWLKEVKITAKKIVKDSQNLNGPGNADLVMDEQDLEKAGKKTWLQVLEENIPGFRQNYGVEKSATTVYSAQLPIDIVTGYQTNGWYAVKFKVARFIIDGVELTPTLVTQLEGDEWDLMTRLNYFLKTHTAEDIKGIELVYSSKLNDAYEIKYPAFDPFIDHAFIEITTRTGNGPFFGYTPGMYLDKPLALSWPKKFYKPKYTAGDTTTRIPEFRSTIDWEPNIFTDKNGMATISFFAADKPSTYTVTIEGTDMNGSVGSTTAKINIGVKKPKEALNKEGFNKVRINRAAGK